MSNEHAKDAVTAPPPASGDWRRPLKMGLLISVVGVGGFVGWAVPAAPAELPRPTPPVYGDDMELVFKFD